MVVYDITRAQTLDNAERWIQDVRAVAEPNVCMILVGNKLDLCEDNPALRQVPYDKAERVAKMHNAMFVEASAFADINVKSTFEDLLQGTFSLIDIVIYDSTRNKYEMISESKARRSVSLQKEQNTIFSNEHSCCV